jgi:N-acetylmuramoyl-L-alanine amidase
MDGFDAKPTQPPTDAPLPTPRRRSYMHWAAVALLVVSSGVLGGAIARLAFPVTQLRTVTGRVLPDAVAATPGVYDWTAHPDPEFPLPPYSQHLRGVKIALDPGHIGQSERNRGKNWKRGPTGLREAAVNLRVSLFLRDFLEAVGAAVTLTRDTDSGRDIEDDDDLRERAAIANAADVDLLLSIHHNAAESPTANYTLVFYHAHPDHSPASLCAARYIQQGLADALRLPTHAPCPVASDFTIYPGAKGGFGLLRYAKVPAVLSEASFFTNPEEEERLRDAVYNRREAYGLFLALSRWAAAGLPRVRLVQSPGTDARARRTSGPAMIVLQLDDGLSARGGFGATTPKILTQSIRVLARETPIAFEFVSARNQLLIDRANLPAGKVELRVDFQNVMGQPVLKPLITIPE